MSVEATSETHPEQSPDEMVEEVDLAGHPVGLVSRREMRARRLCHRSVFIAIVSERGQLLVHRRAETKDIWPGWWDVAVGGVVAPGETWESAARRELREELGIHGVPVHLLGTGAYCDRDVRVVAASFVCRTDGPFMFADGEITEAHWVPTDELPVWLSARRFLPDSLAVVLPRIPLD